MWSHLSHFPTTARGSLAEAFLELKAMEGRGQDATHLLYWSPQASPVCQMDRSVCVIVCVCTCMYVHACVRAPGSAPGTLHSWGQVKAGLQEPSALGLPSPRWAAVPGSLARP